MEIKGNKARWVNRVETWWHSKVGMRVRLWKPATQGDADRFVLVTGNMSIYNGGREALGWAEVKKSEDGFNTNMLMRPENVEESLIVGTFPTLAAAKQAAEGVAARWWPNAGTP